MGTAQITVAETVQQAMPGRNGGLLLRGNVGNRGGTGRRPDRIKRLAQKALLPRVQLLAHLADGVAVHFDDESGTKLISPTPGERIRALEMLHKIGMGETVSTADVRDRLKTQVRLIRASALDEASKELVLSLLGEVWR